MESNRSHYWDNIKGILSIIVVLGHLVEWMALRFDLGYNVWLIIYSFHMPAFCFVSGYMLKHSKKNPIKRIPKFLLIYIVIQLVTHLLDYLSGSVAWSGLNFFEPKYGSWYMLFMVYANIFMCFFDQSKKYYYLIISLILGLLVGFDPSITNTGTLSRFFVFMPFFILGCSFEWDELVQKMKSSALLKKAIPLILSIIWFALLIFLFNERLFNRMVLYGRYPYSAVYPNNILMGLVWRAAVYIIAFTAITALMIICPKRSSIITFLGKNSLYIYAVHIAAIKTVFRWVTSFVTIENRTLCIIITGLITCIILGALIACVKLLITLVKKAIKIKNPQS